MVQISVLLAFHKASPYLEEAVLSILNQSFSDFELILVNDRASDSALSCARRLSTTDARVQILDSDTEGLSGSLNFALRRSRGEFIARLDADDLMVKSRLEKQLSHMHQKPDLVCLGSQVRYFGASTVRRLSRLPLNDWQIRNEVLISNPMAHPSLLIRKEALQEIGGYRNEFGLAQDYEMISRLLEVGRFENLAEPLTHYRIHQDQISSQLGAGKLPYELTVIRNLAFGSSSAENEFDLEDFLASETPEFLFLEKLTKVSNRAKAILCLRFLMEEHSSYQKSINLVRALWYSKRFTLAILISKIVTALKLLPMNWINSGPVKSSRQTPQNDI